LHSIINDLIAMITRYS